MKVIARASDATSAILEKVAVAQQALRGFDGRTVNGAGVLGDPSMRLADLASVKAALDAALEIMRETNWPKDRDYEEYDT